MIVGRPRRQPDQGAVRRHHRLRHLALPRASAACSTMWRTSPCTGRAILGRTHWYMRTNSSRAGWPETWMCSSGPSLITSTPRAISAFCRRPTGALVARDHARGEDRGIALLQHQVAMLAGRELGHRGARLALAAGADEQHLFARQVAALPAPRPSSGNRAGSRIPAPPRPCAAAPGPTAPDGVPPRPPPWRCSRPAPGWRRSRSRRRGSCASSPASRGWRARSPPTPPRPRRTRWCCRTPWRARPRRRCVCRVASSVTSPSSGSGSIFQSPVWNTVPNLVRTASAFGSRIECVMVIISSSNGPTVNLPPSGISVIGTVSNRPASRSLRFSTEAANGVA